ncbi:STAS domain-containing protein [Kitasatospora purpeofusca]|uniref:STAS domain-containing protein n=1 Tax=Kitasatospora purpeofusca TaxID=67352 RepID=UPI002A5A8892|nr:STAS domain-containing protein [Kitasatospora purpeofusca]MDY0810868.1 STAS domain-containing protein [Kitasatospora purpeofusca]
MDLRLSSRRESGWFIVQVEGELDIATRDQLRRRLKRALVRRGRHARLVVDLSRLGFCDASGLAALLDAHATALEHQGQLRLAIPEGRVLRVFRLTDLDRVLPVYPTVRDAVEGRDAVRDATRDVVRDALRDGQVEQSA